MNANTETALERAARLCPSEDIPEARVAKLDRALALGVSDAAFVALCGANRTSTTASIILPAERLEGLSRGTGWARHGRGDGATWGKRVSGGYQVAEPGKWTVGGSDGFQRKSSTTWLVTRVQVGTEVWTVAS